MSDLAYSVSADPGTGIRGPTAKGKERGRMEGECLTSAKGIKGRGIVALPSWQNSAGRRRLTGGNIGSGMPAAGRRWVA